MPDQKIIVFIYLPGEITAVPAGIFTHSSDTGVGSFAYGRKYVARKNALSVDPVALPLGTLPRDATTNKGLFGSFRDSAPDYWGRLVTAVARKVPPEAISEIDFLLDANATRTGNLDFRLTLDAPEPSMGPPHFNQMTEIIESAGAIESGDPVAGHLLQLLCQGTSVGGARPKCTVAWRNALWIAKFPSMHDTLNIPRIEYATLKLAKQCGIRVPEVQIEAAGQKDILLVRRFDLEQCAKGFTRTGFLSALSLMQWDEADRLRWDYAAIADIMRRHTAPSDIRELFRRMVFNILVRNTDDHPRNHGFLFDHTGIRLAPAYDIVPALAIPGVGTDFNLAMNVGDLGREASLDNAVSRVSRFGLTTTEGWAVIHEIKAIIRTWQDHFTALNCPETEIQALIPSFARCYE